MPQTLLNKVAVITGGGSGIGRAMAELFLNEGAKVVLFARNAAPLDEVAALTPARVLTVTGDVTVGEDLARLATAASRRFGQIDILVPAAGIARLAPLVHANASQIDVQLQVNFLGTLNTVRTFVPHLNSNAAVICLTGRMREGCGLGAFNATKAAVAATARSLAVELAPRHIRVNCIAPGPTDTPMWYKTGVSPKQTEQLLSKMTGPLKTARLGTPQDVAEVALFLASESAGHITGQEIVVDGGANV